MRFLKHFVTFCLLLICIGAYSQDYEEDIGAPKDYNLTLQEVQFKFTGSQSFDTDVLEGIINTTKSDNFLRSEFYTDSKRIQKFYFDNGYLDAQIDTSSQYGDDSTQVIATFIINQKAHYKINRVVYNGIENVTPDVRTLLTTGRVLIEGRYYKKADVQLEITRMVAILLNNGYALAQADVPDIVKFITKDSALTDKVDVVLNFTTRDRYKFGKTAITLSNNIYDIEINDLRRELQYNEGEIYSKEKLVASENRISKIAIFENGRIQIDDIDSAKNIINLKINAIVTNKYELKPEILGYDIGGRFYGGAGLTFSNKYFFGGGRVFTAGLKALIHDFDFYRFEGLSTLYQPHLFNNDKITGNNNFGVTSRKEDLSLDPEESKIVGITTVKNLASVKYELKSFTYFNNLVIDWKLANERLKFFFDLPQLGLNGDTILLIRQPIFNIFTSALGLSLISNHVNNLQFPTDGTYATYSFEETGLLGSLVKKIFNTSTSSYLKVTTQNKVYWDFSDENKGTSVLATKFIVGNIFQYGENSFIVDTATVPDELVPNDANYIIGGSTSLRGWRAGRLSAGDVDPVIGGGFIIDGSFEHRTKPFASVSNTLIRDLGFATFFDYGNVWNSYKSFKLSDVAMAIGGGIRYYTIVGAFRFDVGFKLYDPNASQKKWLFENDISTIFRSGDKLQIQFGIGNTF